MNQQDRKKMNQQDRKKMNQQDRTILRDLAKEVAQIAAEEIQQQRTALWKDFNALKPVRPMVLVSPEGGWRDLVNDAHMRCSDEQARKIEWHLRSRLFKAKRIRDDQPISDVWHIPVVVRRSHLGLEPKYIGSGWGSQNAWDWDPPLKDPKDVDKLHVREVRVDWEATEDHRDRMEDLLGDILKVRVDSGPRINVQFARDLILLRGNDQILFDMYDNPEMLHEILSLLLESHLHEMKVLEQQGAYRLNQHPDIYCGTGGLGLTDELPADDCNGQVRPEDLWALVENQEYTGVGPEQVYEFAVKYAIQAVARCPLVYYGCCEPVHDYIDMLLESFPNLRAMSVAPWCDRQIAARALQDKYLYYWKPNPALTCAPNVHWDQVEQNVRETLEIAGQCRLALVLKDTHTFAGDATRPGKWVQIVRKCTEEVLGIEA
jgi:hypothetical protein